MPFVVNDLVIKEDSCNLACEYCLTGQSLFKQDHSLKMIFNPPQQNSCLPGTELHERLQAVLDAVSSQDVPVVKISGGEVFLIKGMMDFIDQLSNLYETVVILTNGVLLTDEKLDHLRALGNAVLQLSLDATTYKGNSYRVPSEKVQNALMERVFRILNSGLPVEIYTVINDRSIETLEQTLVDLKPYAELACLFPFPVRGPNREQFLPKPEQYRYLHRVIDQAEQYNGLLPDSPYLRRLWRFFAENGRCFRCHLPRVAFTTFDDGLVTSCPNIWFNHVGNFVSEPAAQVLQHLEDTPFRKLLLAEQPRLDACKACFTPWDPVSLYFEGELTLEELARVPIYRGIRTRERLAELRTTYIRGGDYAQHNYSDS